MPCAHLVIGQGVSELCGFENWRVAEHARSEALFVLPQHLLREERRVDPRNGRASGQGNTDPTMDGEVVWVAVRAV